MDVFSAYSFSDHVILSRETRIYRDGDLGKWVIGESIDKSFKFENFKHAQGSKYASLQLSRIKRLSFPSEAKG